MAEQQELAKATLPEKPRTPRSPALTPSEVRVGEIRDEMGGKTTLDALTSAMESSRPVDMTMEQSLLDSNFGSERNATTGRKELTDPATGARTESGVRKDRAETVLTNARELLSGNLTPDHRALVVSDLVSTFESLPVYADVFRGLTPTQRKATAEKLLTNPDLLAKVRASYEQGIDPSLALTDEITPAQKAYDEADTERAKKDQEKTDNGAKLTDARDLQRDFTETTASGATTKTRHDELLELREDSSGNPRDLEDELRTANQQKNQARNRLDAFTTARNKMLAEGGLDPSHPKVTHQEDLITSEGDKLSAAEKAVGEARKNKERRRELEAEKSSIPDEIARLEAEEVRLITEYTELEKAKLIAQADLHSKKTSREQAEEAYALQTERILPDALREFLRDELEKADTADQAVIEKKKSETADQAKKIVLEQLLKRWKKTRAPTRFDKRTSEPDKFRAEADWATVIADPNGRKAVLKDMLTAGGVLTPEQIDEKMQDETFVAEMLPEVTRKVIRERMRYGKFTPSDREFLMESDWGQQAVTDAIASRQKFIDDEQKLIQEGIIGNEGLAHYLKNKKGLNVLGILALLFTAVPAALTVSTMYDSVKSIEASAK